MPNLGVGDYILNQLFTSRFIKKKLASVLLALAANFFEMQVVSVLSYLVSFHPYVDFFLQIGFSVVFAINIDYFYDALARYEDKFYRLSRYLINNYTFENYLLWKRMVMSAIGVYALIILSIVEINNKLILIYLSQSCISFIIIDRYQQRMFHQILKEYQDAPSKTIHTKMPNDLIESYFPNRPPDPVVRLLTQPESSSEPNFGINEKLSQSVIISKDGRTLSRSI